MDQRSSIPGLVLLALSFTHCGANDPAADPIVGDWRAIQVDGEKHPQNASYGDGLVGELLHVDADLEGDMTRYETRDADGFDYLLESIADLVVDASAAPKYRLDVAHDFFDGSYDQPSVPGGTGQPDTGYADSGVPDPGYDDTGDTDTGDYANADDLAEARPLKLPTDPALAPGALIFDCTLEGDTLTCDREGAEELKHWVFTRVRPGDET